MYWGIPKNPCRKRGDPARTLPPQHCRHRLSALPSLLTPKMIVSHVELEEQMRYANAHYLRKAGVHNNNNASNVLYARRIFTILMCAFDFSCSTMTTSYPPLCLMLQLNDIAIIGLDARSFSMQLDHCILLNTFPGFVSSLHYW